MVYDGVFYTKRGVNLLLYPFDICSGAEDCNALMYIFNRYEYFCISVSLP